MFESRLRYFSVEGRLIPTPEEANLEEIRKAEIAYRKAEAEKQRAESEKQKAESEKQKAEIEKQRAEAEKQRAEDAEAKAAILAQRLRDLGINPDSL